jgi:hypothetical protein
MAQLESAEEACALGLSRRLRQVGVNLQKSGIDAMLVGYDGAVPLAGEASTRHPTDWRVPAFDAVQISRRAVATYAGDSVRSQPAVM